jgi:predicted DNA-binding protein
MKYVQIVDICCRDLRRYLQNALLSAKGGVVTVKMWRLLRVELSPPDRARYSMCLSRVLHAYRWKNATYVIPRQDVETLLKNLDAMCENVKRRREPQPNPPPQPRSREKMVLISFHLPRKMLQMLDSYAAELKTTRSAVIRRAIAQMLKVAEEQMPLAAQAPT